MHVTGHRETEIRAPGTEHVAASLLSVISDKPVPWEHEELEESVAAKAVVPPMQVRSVIWQLLAEGRITIVDNSGRLKLC